MPRERAYCAERSGVLGGQKKDMTVQKCDRTEKMSAGITVSRMARRRRHFISRRNVSPEEIFESGYSA
jgi:hypothetical protein